MDVDDLKEVSDETIDVLLNIIKHEISPKMSNNIKQYLTDTSTTNTQKLSEIFQNTSITNYNSNPFLTKLQQNLSLNEFQTRHLFQLINHIITQSNNKTQETKTNNDECIDKLQSPTPQSLFLIKFYLSLY